MPENGIFCEFGFSNGILWEFSHFLSLIYLTFFLSFGLRHRANIKRKASDEDKTRITSPSFNPNYHFLITIGVYTLYKCP